MSESIGTGTIFISRSFSGSFTAPLHVGFYRSRDRVSTQISLGSRMERCKPPRTFSDVTALREARRGRPLEVTRAIHPDRIDSIGSACRFHPFPVYFLVTSRLDGVARNRVKERGKR
ncbi:MAG: hypothetical protein D6812_01805 [Deltaproteobacteria bacterium]|nr:MAG: hypothetical protein D6812_01805 [Deltaproteobacteria bacterium]